LGDGEVREVGFIVYVYVRGLVILFSWCFWE
jgi:hypothetical protein